MLQSTPAATTHRVAAIEIRQPIGSLHHQSVTRYLSEEELGGTGFAGVGKMGGSTSASTCASCSTSPSPGGPWTGRSSGDG